MASGADLEFGSPVTLWFADVPPSAPIRLPPHPEQEPKPSLESAARTVPWLTGGSGGSGVTCSCLWMGAWQTHACSHRTRTHTPGTHASTRYRAVVGDPRHPRLGAPNRWSRELQPRRSSGRLLGKDPWQNRCGGVDRGQTTSPKLVGGDVPCLRRGFPTLQTQDLEVGLL